MVGELLAGSELEDEVKKKIVGACWIIAHCRMEQLLAEDEDSGSVRFQEGLPGVEHAQIIVDKLAELHLEDSRRFKELTKQATKEEKGKLGEQKKSARDEKKKREKPRKIFEELRDAAGLHAVDIALFGRMTTSAAFTDVEAAMQVAHAISTHEVVNETDYFTAVDDLGKAGGGAAHVQEAMFNSACFYQYFCLDWDQLVSNLSGPQKDEQDSKPRRNPEEQYETDAKELAACTLGHFIRAAALTTPSGKQNSFASHSEACGILVEIKQDKIPTSYANAFAEPVERIGKPDDDGPDEKSTEGRSVACLADHVYAVRNAYGIESRLLWYSPKLWRFPFRRWSRADDGTREKAVDLADERFDALGGGDSHSKGLVEAVVKEVGFDWADVRNLGNTTTQEAQA
jgi:hypothetical protein